MRKYFWVGALVGFLELVGWSLSNLFWRLYRSFGCLSLGYHWVFWNKFVRPILAWVPWERLAIPKALGGWGLKNIFLFAKALAAKVTWRLIHTKSLWYRVIHQKYIVPLIIMYWIRMEDKQSWGCSIIWKAII